MSQNDFTSDFSIVLTLDFEIVVVQNVTQRRLLFCESEIILPNIACYKLIWS